VSGRSERLAAGRHADYRYVSTTTTRQADNDFCGHVENVIYDDPLSRGSLG